MDDSQHDPQRLLAELAAEYERSRRFLQQLESALVREPESDAPCGTRPTGDGDGQLEPDDLAADPPTKPSGQQCPDAATEPMPQPESAPAKLRAKLRSFFSRRASPAADTRKDVSDSGAFTTPAVRTTSESQSTVSSRYIQQPAERPANSFAASSSPRRSSAVYYSTNSMDQPRAPRGGAAGAEGGRSGTARRSSVVYFGGDAMDSANQGWVARVGAGGDAAGLERPATARRTSLVYCGGAAADTGMAEAARVASSRMSAEIGAERPATARRASIVQFGDTVATPGGGLYGYGGGGGGGAAAAVPSGGDAEHTVSSRGADVFVAAAPGCARKGPSVHFGNSSTAAAAAAGGGGTISGGVSGSALLETTEPHEFMAAMASAGTLRTNSFHTQRSGTALTPTSQRLRGTTSARRKSVDAYFAAGSTSGCSRDGMPQQHLQQPSRSSLEFRPAPPTEFADAAAAAAASHTRRTSSLDLPRSFSGAAQRSQQHPAAASAAAAAAVAAAAAIGGFGGTPVNVGASSLFAPVALSGSTASAAALAAAVAGGSSGGGAAAAVHPFSQVGMTPAPTLRFQNLSVQGPSPLASQLRVQQPPAAGVAWASTAAGPCGGAGGGGGSNSPLLSPSSGGRPAPPADASAVLSASRNQIIAGPAAAALRSLSSKRLLDLCEGAAPPPPMNAAAAAAGFATAACGATAAVREHGVSSPGMLEMSPSAPPPSVQQGAASAAVFAARRGPLTALRVAVGPEAAVCGEDVSGAPSPAAAAATSTVSPGAGVQDARSGGSCNRLMAPSPPPGPPPPPIQPQPPSLPSPSSSPLLSPAVSPQPHPPSLLPHPPSHPHHHHTPKALSIFRMRGAAAGLMTTDGAFAGGGGGVPDSASGDSDGVSGGATGSELQAVGHVLCGVRVDERPRSVAGC